jgi:hypothetical protein
MRSTVAGPRHFALNQGRVPARSVDLITAEIYEVFLHAGDPALVEVVVFTAVFMVAAGGAERTHV